MCVGVSVSGGGRGGGGCMLRAHTATKTKYVCSARGRVHGRMGEGGGRESSPLQSDLLPRRRKSAEQHECVMGGTYAAVAAFGCVGA
jgi:hypothetical protein